MAGFDFPSTRKTMVAGAAVRKGQFVKLSSGKVIPCSVLGEAFFGVCDNDQPDINGEVSVTIEGECVVETAVDTIGVDNALSPIMTDASGRAVLFVTSNSCAGFILERGIALVSSTAATRRALIKRALPT